DVTPIVPSLFARSAVRQKVKPLLKTRAIGRAPQDVLVGAIEPIVNVVIVRLEVFPTTRGAADEAGNHVLIAQPILQRIDPPVHFALSRRSGTVLVLLVVGNDPNALALQTAGKIVGHGHW